MKAKKPPKYFLPNPDPDVLNWPMRLVISKIPEEAVEDYLAAIDAPDDAQWEQV